MTRKFGLSWTIPAWWVWPHNTVDETIRSLARRVQQHLANRFGRQNRKPVIVTAFSLIPAGFLKRRDMRETNHMPI